MERTESWSLGLRPVQSQWPWVLWGRVSGPLRVQTTEVREMCLRPLRRGSSRGQRARGRCPLPTEGPVGRGQGGRSELQWRWLGFQGGLPSASQLIRSPSPLTPKGHKKTHLTFWGSRQWHPTPVLLPGKSHGRRSLVGCSPWGP